jgi:hypothetical protein
MTSIKLFSVIELSRKSYFSKAKDSVIGFGTMTHFNPAAKADWSPFRESSNANASL